MNKSGIPSMFMLSMCTIEVSLNHSPIKTFADAWLCTAQIGRFFFVFLNILLYNIFNNMVFHTLYIDAEIKRNRESKCKIHGFLVAGKKVVF